MAKLEILEFPDKRLRTVAKAVDEVDETMRNLVSDMLETMYESRGVGLAATQVNVHQRILVMDVSEDGDQPQCFINPEIIAREGEQMREEGCLSVPGYFAKVQRAEKVTVRALNEKGEVFETDAEGLMSVCLQHEMDHLDGKLFVDYLSPLKRERLRKKLEKSHKLQAV